MAVPRYRSGVVGSIPDIAEPSRADVLLYGGLADLGQGLAQTAFGEHRRMVLKAAQERGILDGVRRAPDGKLTWRPREDDTEAAEAYNRAAAVGYVTSLKGDTSEHASNLAREHERDPEAFQAAWSAASEGWLSGVPDTLQPEIELHMRQLGQRSLNHILDNRREFDTKQALASADRRIKQVIEEAVSLAGAGQGGSPDMALLVSEIHEIGEPLVNVGALLPDQLAGVIEVARQRVQLAAVGKAVKQTYQDKNELAALRQLEALYDSEELADIPEAERRRGLSRIAADINRLEQVRAAERSEALNGYMARLQAGESTGQVLAEAQRSGLKPGQLLHLEQMGAAVDQRVANLNSNVMATNLLRGVLTGETTFETLAAVPKGILNPEDELHVLRAVIQAEGHPPPGTPAFAEWAARRQEAVTEMEFNQRFADGNWPTKAQIDEAFPPPSEVNARLTRMLMSGQGGEIATNQARMARVVDALNSPDVFLFDPKDASALLMNFNSLVGDSGTPPLANLDQVERAPQMLFAEPGNVPTLAMIATETGMVAPEVKRGLEIALTRSQDPTMANNAMSFLRGLETSREPFVRAMAADLMGSLPPHVVSVYAQMRDGVPYETAVALALEALPTSSSSENRARAAVDKGLLNDPERVAELDAMLDSEAVEAVEHSWFWRNIARPGLSMLTFNTPEAVWNYFTSGGFGDVKKTFSPGVLDKVETPPIPAAMRAEFHRHYSYAAGKMLKTPEGRDAAAAWAAAKTFENWKAVPYQASSPLNINPDTPVTWQRQPWTKIYRGPHGDLSYAFQQIGRAYDENEGFLAGERPAHVLSGAEMLEAGRLWLVVLPGSDPARPEYGLVALNEAKTLPRLLTQKNGQPVVVELDWDKSAERRQMLEATRQVRERFGPALAALFGSILTDLYTGGPGAWEKESRTGRVARAMANAKRSLAGQGEGMRREFWSGGDDEKLPPHMQQVLRDMTEHLDD